MYTRYMDIIDTWYPVLILVKVTWYLVLIVCVLHMKLFFLPVVIQHNQCPCRFFIPINNDRRDTTSSVYLVCVCSSH